MPTKPKGTLAKRNAAAKKKKHKFARRYDQNQKNRASVEKTLRTGPHASEGFSPMKKQKIKKPRKPRVQSARSK